MQKNTSRICTKNFYALLDTWGRSGPRRYSERDPPHTAHPGGRPVIDVIDMVGEILFWDAGFRQTDGDEIVHRDEGDAFDRGDTVAIREGSAA